MSTKSIGDRPLSLAAHLRAAVNLLLDEAGTQYSWDNMTQCNCGLLARCITDWTEEKRIATHERLRARQSGRTGSAKGWWIIFCDDRGAISWTGHVRGRCLLTRTPMAEVIGALFAAGMDESDFEHVEYLCHPELMDGASCDSRSAAAAYLQRWAEAIERFHAEAAKTETPVALDTMTESAVLAHR